jgi:hypothetical protein
MTDENNEDETVATDDIPASLRVERIIGDPAEGISGARE